MFCNWLQELRYSAITVSILLNEKNCGSANRWRRMQRDHIISVLNGITCDYDTVHFFLRKGKEKEAHIVRHAGLFFLQVQ